MNLDADTFFARIRRDPDACWPWGRSLDYGRTKRNGRSTLTHRIAFEFAFGSIPDGMCVLHRCDNPPCCNPAHLFLGTRADNNRDRDSKGRTRYPSGSSHGSKTKPQSVLRGSRHGRARFDEAAVAEMRALLAAGHSLRAVGAMFGTTKPTIHDIASRRTWRHVP